MAKTRIAKPKPTGCEACPLNNTIKVPGVGPSDSPLVIVGMNPGAQELKTRKPFVGRSGALLDTILAQAGLNRQDIYITNSVLCACFPVADPPAKAVVCCKQRLHDEVAARNPKVVLALGKIPTKALLGLNLSMTEERGRVVPAPHLGKNTVVVLAYHPAYILRNPRLHRDLLADVTKAGQLARAKTPTEVTAHIHIEYEVLTNHYALLKFLQDTDRYPAVALDVETASSGQLLCLGLSVEEGRAVVVTRPALTFATRELQEWLSKKLVVTQSKYDLLVLRRLGVYVETGADTLLMSYVRSPILGGHGLKTLVRDHLNFYEDYSAVTKPYIKCMENCPKDSLYLYNAQDTALTLMLYRKLEQELDSDDRRLLSTLLYPANNACVDMEMTGSLVDIPYLERLNEQLTAELYDLEQRMFTLVGRDFNPRSNPQLMSVMFKDLELPIPARFSTDKKALAILTKVSDHPFLELLQQHRTRSKFASTYVRALLRQAKNSPDSRVHTTFSLHVTKTGRLSSKRPNLQNQPKTTEARNIFVAAPGCTLIECDEQQGEIRGWCWLSRDEELKRALTSAHIDVHRGTASLMWGILPDEVTDEQRYKGKRLSFATLYQMDDKTLAGELGVTTAKAVELQTKFFSAYPQGHAWILERKKTVHSERVYITPFGRKLILEDDPSDPSALERIAVNHPIQSLLSDIALAGLIRVHKAIQTGKLGASKLTLTVHDSVLVETAEPPQEIAREMKRIMEIDVLDGWLPFPVDVQAGVKWGEMQKLT